MLLFYPLLLLPTFVVDTRDTVLLYGTISLGRQDGARICVQYCTTGAGGEGGGVGWPFYFCLFIVSIDFKVQFMRPAHQIFRIFTFTLFVRLRKLQQNSSTLTIWLSPHGLSHSLAKIARENCFEEFHFKALLELKFSGYLFTFITYFLLITISILQIFTISGLCQEY